MRIPLQEAYTAARIRSRWQFAGWRLFALLTMLLLAVATTPTRHVPLADVPEQTAAASPSTAPDATVSGGDRCCVGCPAHGCEVPIGIAAVAETIRDGEEVTYAAPDTHAASLSRPPPTRPPRLRAGVVDAG